MIQSLNTVLEVLADNFKASIDFYLMSCDGQNSKMLVKSRTCTLPPLRFSSPEALLTLGRVPKDRAILWAESDSWPVRSSEPRRCTRQGRTTDTA